MERKLRWSWYGRKYTRKHKTIGRATCARGGESRYILGVSEARPQIKLFAHMDSILPPPAILVSSTSGIPMCHIQSECKYPERCVTGHPFNPPHLIPLVEVVGGAKTSAVDCRTRNAFLHRDGKAGVAYSQGDRRTCGKPPSGSAVPGSSLSDRSRCGQRGGRRRRSLPGSRSALGSDGSEPDLSSGGADQVVYVTSSSISRA